MTFAGCSEVIRRELLAMGERERGVVLRGLRAKLSHYDGTGRLSYRYEVCPVCQDVGSTAAQQRCEACYIRQACRAPFDQGFRDDPARGAAYFRGMLRFLECLEGHGRVLVVGGRFASEWKPSTLVRRLAEELGAFDVCPGGTLEDLDIVRQEAEWADVVLWMPSVDNGEAKDYPRKKRGSILICSKVMRDGYTRFDSVSRIFRMGANAVLEVYRYPGSVQLALVDALGNEWVSSADMDKVARGIDRFLAWAQGVQRVPSRQVEGSPVMPDGLPDLAAVVRLVADRVENERGGRYFGNASTRCMAMFPILRAEEPLAWVSARNVDKQRLAAEDFVPVRLHAGGVEYCGARKPSVDTPVQVALYERFPQLGYMIHGHAFIEGAATTEEYFPCGDMREVRGVIALLEAQASGPLAGAINLRQHGFLLYAETLDALRAVVAAARFINVVPAPGAGTSHA